MHGELPPVRGNGLSKSRLGRAIEFIDKNLEQHLTPATMASAVALSQAHFARAFKVSTGMTPMRYLWSRRVECAKRAMADDPECSLVDAAVSCGFSSHSHFITVFRRVTGMTPSAWRSKAALMEAICFICGSKLVRSMIAASIMVT